MCSRLVLSSSEKTESEITYHERKSLWTVHDDVIPCHLILKRVLPEIQGQRRIKWLLAISHVEQMNGNTIPIQYSIELYRSLSSKASPLRRIVIPLLIN